jgi:hypothetical protein
MQIWYKMYNYLFYFFSFLKKEEESSIIAKLQKNIFCFQLKILLVYSLTPESRIFIFTNTRIKNRNTRIEIILNLNNY